MQFIDLNKQYNVLKEDIDKNISKVLNDSKFIMGEEVKILEDRLAKYVGVDYCATCGNGTDALYIALKCLNIGEGDCVFLPSLTFFSTSEMVSLAGATPIFIDSDEETFNIDPEKLEKAIIKVKEEGKLNPKCVIAVDLYGLPANFPKVREICDKYNLYLVEDGAQGFGGSLNGKKNLSFGDISTTSFFPAKPLGCYGDGGALFTNNKELYDLMLSYRVHGKGREKYDNVRVGLNSRLDTIQAAILLVKLDALEKYELNRRQEIFKMYNDRLKDYAKTPYIPEGYISGLCSYTLILDGTDKRDFVRKYLEEKGIPTMIYYPVPMHKQNVYKGYDFNLNDLKTCEYLIDNMVSLPFHPYLEENDIEFICNNFIEALEAYKNE